MKKVEIIGGANGRRPFAWFEENFGLPENIRPSAGASPAPPAGSGPRADLPVVPRVDFDAKRAAESSGVRVERIRLRMRNLRDLPRRALAIKILEGESFAAPGERDYQLNRMAATISFIAPEATAEELLGIFRPSLVAMRLEANDPRNPAPTDEDALDKIGRKIEQARRAREKELAINERIRATLIKEARESPKAPADPGTPSAPEGERTDETEVGEYTLEEIDNFAASQDCSGEEFRKRWIIQRGASYYVFCRGTYQEPLIKEELETSLPRDLAPVPSSGHSAAIDWFTTNANGTLRKKKPNELVYDYGTVARKTSINLTLRRSYYDPSTHTIHEAACPLRDLEPVYNEAIDEWLRIFGGAEADKLLDWLATLTQLDRQTCALYLSGPRGTGKTLLTSGASRLWIAEGAPTELGRILENFNGDLLRCPLVFADEAIPQSFGQKRGSAELRQIIGSSARTISRKFLPNATLVGAIRLVLAANNERLLGFDEDLSKDDLDAVSQRFLHIETDEKAAAFLTKLGGRSGSVASWIDGDGIAKHALWLRDNRRVIPGDRFLVEGHQTRLHQNLPTQGKTNGLVAEWLVKLLNAPVQKRQAIETTGLVLIGDGAYLVNAEAIAQSWAQFISSDGPPATGRIGRALRTMSLGVRRIHDARFHAVNLDLIYSWAEENLIGKPEMMKMIVERKIGDKEMAPVRRSLMASV